MTGATVVYYALHGNGALPDRPGPSRGGFDRSCRGPRRRIRPVLVTRHQSLASRVAERHLDARCGFRKDSDRLSGWPMRAGSIAIVRVLSASCVAATG